MNCGGQSHSVIQRPSACLSKISKLPQIICNKIYEKTDKLITVSFFFPSLPPLLPPYLPHPAFCSLCLSLPLPSSLLISHLLPLSR